MDKKLQEILDKANEHLKNKKFDEGLAILKEWSDEIPEIENIRNKLDQEKLKEIDIILNELEKACAQKEWNVAFDLLKKAQDLDSKDSKVRSAADMLHKASAEYESESEFDKKKQRAKNLLSRTGKVLKDVDTAIKLMEEVISKKPGDLDAESLLNEAQGLRSVFLQGMGQVTTFQQAEQYEEAIREINDLIARGFKEFEGKDIFKFRGELEKKQREFADQKAEKYFNKAEAEVGNNPKLALSYIEKGLSLHAIPKPRRDALEDLKIKAEDAVIKYKEIEELIKKARGFMDAQKYEQAISVLDECLVKIPGYKDAKTYRELAQNGLRNLILKEARIVVARVESGISKENFKKFKEDLLSTLDKLHIDGEDAEKLRTRCKELLEEIKSQEQIEKTLDKAVTGAQKALKDEDFEAAQGEIESLDKNLQNRPEVRKIRSELTRRLKIEDGFNKAKQAFEDDNLESAQEQIRILRRRARKNKDIETLYKEIESKINLNKGFENFKDGLTKEARSAFKKVIALEGDFIEEANEYLGKIEALSDQDKKARQKYNAALKLKEKESYKEAYYMLAEVEDLASSVKSKILSLRLTVRNKWRLQLVKQIRSCIKSKTYGNILELVDSLKEIQQAEDSKLIDGAYKEYYKHEASKAVTKQNWDKAYQLWEEAQKIDINDKRVNKGLLVAKKQKVFREAEAAQNEHQAISILKNMIERETFDLTTLDFKIEERLYRAFLLVEDFNGALALAGIRLGLNSKFSTKAKTIREFCFKLNESKDKFEYGAYKDSLDILTNCLEVFLEYSDIIQILYQSRVKKIIKKLLEEANELERDKESEVRILSKYRELLKYEPNHRKAKNRNDELLTRFNRNVNDIIQEAVQMQKDENVSSEEIDDMVNQIHEIMIIANDKQKTRLTPHLDSLTKKFLTARNLYKKLRQIEAYLNEAKETGDFSPVDYEWNDVVDTVGFGKNRACRKLLNKIQTAKDQRKKCVDLADKIEKAYKNYDFSNIEIYCDDLKRLDEDDEFFIQRHRLKFEDTISGQEVSFGELKEWAKNRRQNLEKLTAWFDGNGVNTDALAEEENILRQNVKNDLKYTKFAYELQKLITIYKNGVEQLVTRPESPFSEPAEKVVKEADILKIELKDKIKKLENEAQQIIMDEEKVKDFVDKASELINSKKFGQALQYVEDGLEISPAHVTLLHYKNIIDND